MSENTITCLVAYLSLEAMSEEEGRKTAQFSWACKMLEVKCKCKCMCCCCCGVLFLGLKEKPRKQTKTRVVSQL